MVKSSVAYFRYLFNLFASKLVIVSNVSMSSILDLDENTFYKEFSYHIPSMYHMKVYSLSEPYEILSSFDN